MATEPGSAPAHVALGHALAEQRRYREAEEFLARAVALDPREPDAHYLLGNACHGQQRPAEAERHYRAALALRADFAEARHGLGVALRLQGRLDEALACFDAVLAQRPGHPPSRLNQALILLLRGDLARGFQLFESRLEAPGDAQVASWLAMLAARSQIARWRGEPLAGRTLLLWTEEGAGDCLMMLRYLRGIGARGAGGIHVLTDPSLAGLIRDLPGVTQVVTGVEQVSWRSIEAHCPIMSLPLAFGTRAESIPREVPYLEAPRALQERWHGRLAALGGVKVGLVWAGSKKFGRDFLRSLAAPQLAPILEVPGASFVSLQKEPAPRERAFLQGHAADWMDECLDFLDTASLVAQLDLVISVDTSVAHLAGALGKPVWLLNRHESEWRWRLGREDSDWYPTMRIFTQPAPGDWGSVMRRVAQALAALARGPARP